MLVLEGTDVKWKIVPQSMILGLTIRRFGFSQQKRTARVQKAKNIEYNQ